MSHLQLLVTLIVSTAVIPLTAADAPFPYVDATAHYVLPQTHNNQSGYFSLCEGLDGNVYVGTARYGENAHLVEYDPRSQKQRVVLDVNEVCGLTARDYAAQAKIHTRNAVGSRSGKIYVGSKQGYRIRKDDVSEYPGGYVLSYDPRTGQGQNLGMPFKTQGVADVAVDEERGLLYVVTCEDQHWMLGTATRGGPYRELGPMLTPYAMTLVGADGIASAITKDFELAQYDPVTQKVTLRPIEVAGKRWTRAGNASIPTWQLAPDRKSAWLILMNDPTLLRIDLTAGKDAAKAESFGKLTDGKNPDSRCGLDVGADGRVWAVVRVDNASGFGKGYLHQLLRFDPATGKTENLGVLRVKNPDFFDFKAKGPDGKPQPWTHGYHTLPDGALTPLHAHMSLMVTRDNTVYVTVIYPFSLLRIDAFRTPPRKSAARQALDGCMAACDRAEKQLPQITSLAGTLADRHLKGGMIGVPFPDDALMQELYGRSGNIIHVGFDRPWKKDRTDDEKKNDIAIVGVDKPLTPRHVADLKKLRDRGVWVIGLGPAASRTDSFDAWIDSGAELGLDSTFANAVNAWTLMAETVSALTRSGKMPTMWKSWAHDDGKAWGERYFLKTQFHDDMQVAPIPAGELGAIFLRQIRHPLRRLRPEILQSAAAQVSAELKAGRKTVIAWQGHMPMTYIGRFGTDAWAVAAELHPFLDSQIDSYQKKTPDGALVISLGYHGLDPKGAAVWKQKSQRVIHLAGEHPESAWNARGDVMSWTDLGFAFGDACVTIDGYPIRVLPPSGVVQLAAFGAIDAEMRATVAP